MPDRRSRPRGRRSERGDRGQSETLGFVLVFSLVVAIIGVTFATGFGGLQDVRDAEQVNNAQRAFEVLSDNIEDLVHRTAPSRGTEIKLASANLRLADAIEVNVSVDSGSFNESYQVRPLRYDADTGTSLFYSAGALLREDGGNAIVATESTFLLDDNRTIIPVVQTRAHGTSSIGGSGSVLVRTRVATRSIQHSNDTDGTTVWLNITTPRAGAWHDHLSDKGDVSCEPIVDDTVACNVTTDRLYVTLVRVDVSVR